MNVAASPERDGQNTAQSLRSLAPARMISAIALATYVRLGLSDPRRCWGLT
jgi:hypothetical protein